jgi:hypothetical protein
VIASAWPGSTDPDRAASATSGNRNKPCPAAISRPAWWSYAFTLLFESIHQGRFAEVSPDLTAIIGRVPASFEAALHSGPTE